MAAKNRREDKPARPPSPVVHTGTSIIPMAMLDADARQRFFDEGAALAEAEVGRTPSYVEERIAWMKGVAATAWADREALVRVALNSGKLTVEEIRELAARVEHLNIIYLRWRDARTTGTAATAGSEGARRISALRVDQRAIQRRLLAAFDVRFEGDRAGRALLSDIRKGSGDADILNDNVRILRLCNAEEHRAWLAEMPKGEAAAAKTLATLHAEFSKLLDSDAHDPATLKDLLDRAWTLCAARFERVLKAGRYHVSDNPARKDDYAGFRPPKARKPRAKKPAPVAPPSRPA